MTAVEKAAQYNREYRARVKAEKRNIVHQATIEEMDVMKEKWLKSNKITVAPTNSKEFSMPAPMIINSGLGGTIL